MAGQRAPVGLAHPITDSPFYQALLVDLAQVHQQHGPRVTTAAIDRWGRDTDRDQAMAENVQAQVAMGTYDRVVVLVGNLHAVRQMQWAADAWRPAPKLAEWLIQAKLRVTSVMQDLDAGCPSQRWPVFFNAQDAHGQAAIAQSIEPVQHHLAMDMRQAADGVVVWQCREEAVEVEAGR